MKSLKTMAFAAVTLALLSCGGDKKDSIPTASSETSATTETTASSSSPSSYDPKRGLGPVSYTHLDVYKRQIQQRWLKYGRNF